MSTEKISRKEAREAVFCLLFETEFKQDETPEDIYAISCENREIADDPYIKTVYFGVCEKKNEIDELIGRFSHGWKTSRMSRASRSVIRLCVYEMKYMEDIPSHVSINEAVELTKKYDEEKARAFVNGILNSVKNELEGQPQQGESKQTPGEKENGAGNG